MLQYSMSKKENKKKERLNYCRLVIVNSEARHGMMVTMYIYTKGNRIIVLAEFDTK